MLLTWRQEENDKSFRVRFRTTDGNICADFHKNGTEELPNWQCICSFLYKILFSKGTPLYA